MSDRKQIAGSVRRSALSILAFVLLLPLASCIHSSSNALPLADVDLSRMYGGWYIIATIPNFFEKKLVQPYDVYSLRPDGDIAEDFYFRSGSFNTRCRHLTAHDRVRPGTRNAAWQVQLIWPIKVPFLIAYVDPNYRFAIFGEDNRQLGWIYARSPTIDDSDYALLRVQLAALGYDPNKFRKFLQEAAQFGDVDTWSSGIKEPGAPSIRCGP